MVQELVDDAPGDVKKSAPPQVRTGGLRLQHMMFVVGVVALLCWLWAVAGGWLVLVTVVLLVGFAFGSVAVLIQRGSTERESLLSALAIAAEQSMPLAPAAEAFSEQFGWSFRWRTQLLARLLREGTTLPDAFDQVPGAITRDGLLLIKAGTSAGVLPQALRDASESRSRLRTAFSSVAGRFVYLFAVFTAVQTILGFIMYFIMPKYEAIFKDFGIPLPQVTIVSIQMSHWFVSLLLPLVVLVLVPVVALALVATGVFRAHLWDVPLIDWLFRRRHVSLLLNGLALTVEGGKPIVEGLKVLSEDYPSRWVKRRLRAVLAIVEGGGGWIEALWSKGLIQPAEASVLMSAERVGNLSWALRETGASADRRLRFRLELLLQTLFPVAVLALGALVFFMAVAYFLPLVSLIERLSG